MNPWKQRLTKDLEPVLLAKDPRPSISRYHDLPFGIFVYPPEDEFAVRKEIGLLTTRLQQTGKRVTTVSMAECLHEALQSERFCGALLAETEESTGLEITVETVAAILSERQRLDHLIVRRVPENAEATRDIVLITRAGALFPLYRMAPLLEQLMGQLRVPAVLFYPGVTDGPAGLRFMGVLDADHGYRPKIF